MHRACRRIGFLPRPDTVWLAFFELDDQVFRLASVGIRIVGRLRCDQILMIKKGTAESSHEEIVAKRESARDLIEVQVRRRVAIMAHRKRASVPPGDEAIVASAVDLQLMVIEAMDQVAGDKAMWQRITSRCLQTERRVGKRRE